MKKYLIPICLGATMLTAGCQTLPSAGSTNALYPGNEVRDQWYTSYHRLATSNGTEYRGYRSSFRRHWLR